MTKAKVAVGIKCLHCERPIERYKIPGNGVRRPFDTWIHTGTSNVWCQTNLVGATAKFAEPS